MTQLILILGLFAGVPVSERVACDGCVTSTDSGHRAVGLASLVDTRDFPDRWHCGTWTSLHGWMHIASDTAIWLAYLGIPIAIASFVRRRRDVPFIPIFWLFVAFILACGFTHFFEALMFWWPAYRLMGVMKVITAIISWCTLIALFPILPKALTLRTPAELQRLVDERTNALRENEHRLLSLNRDLEARVEARTQELVQANAHFGEQNARLTAIMANAADGIITVDDRGCIQAFNDAAEKIFGYTSAEVVGENISMLMPEPHQSAHDGYLANYRAHGVRRIIGQRRELAGLRKDGSTFPMDLHVSEAAVDGRRFFTGIIQDITERKEVERAAAQTQKLEAIGRLAAGVAHEINTPMQFIGDNVRFLERTCARTAPILDIGERVLVKMKSAGIAEREVVELENAMETGRIRQILPEIPGAISQSLEGVERVSRIVSALKDFSHPGNQTRTPTDLNKAIESTITVARHEWKYVATVTLELDPAMPPVTCLVGELNQAILNIVVNASHAIRAKYFDSPGPSGLITIRTRVANDEAIIEIEDDGIGISPQNRAKLFDPFFTTKRFGEGTGQGLAMAYGAIVEKHGGAIDVTSTEDVGTKFTIRLPLEAAKVS